MQDEMLARLCGAVSGPGMMEHVREFARHVKLSGTPGERESLEYVRRRIAEYGFTTDLIEHDAYISLPGAARVIAAGREITAITHSFSRPSREGGTRAPLVHVGPGSPKAFRDNDVRGKIVLVEGIASPAVSQRASDAGAIGQLHVSPHQYLHEMCISPVWGSPSQRTMTRLPATVVCTIAKEDGEALRRRLVEGEKLEVELHAEVDTGWRRTPILVAELAAPDAPEDAPFVMFSGHHDTWYYGVMDNGTANATMLECARLLAAERAQWKRGLRICFWSGHSHGRYSGSTWYADEHWAELDRRCAVHVNVDSTGAKGNTYLGDAPAAAELVPLAREAVRMQAGQEIDGKRMSRAGDQSFWGVGIPSMFMSMGQQQAGETEDVMGGVLGQGTRKGAGLGWWWHTPHDLLDKIEPDLLVRDTRIFVHTLWRLLHDAVLPLDYGEHAGFLLSHLASLGEGLDGRFDLSPLVSRAETLARNTAALNERGRGAEGAEAERTNRALMRLARALVPMDYTSGDRFEQDAALSMEPYSALQALRWFATTAPESDIAKHLMVGLTRSRNRVAHALDQANAAIEDYLAAAPTPPPQAARRKRGKP